MKISELIGQLCEIEHKEGNILVNVAKATKRGTILQSAVKRLETNPANDMYDEVQVRIFFGD